jgi:hypothetical protein
MFDRFKWCRLECLSSGRSLCQPGCEVDYSPLQIAEGDKLVVLFEMGDGPPFR